MNYTVVTTTVYSNTTPRAYTGGNDKLAISDFNLDWTQNKTVNVLSISIKILNYGKTLHWSS